MPKTGRSAIFPSIAAIAALALTTATCVRASSITFDFNSISSNSNASVQNYLDSVLDGTTVTGAGMFSGNQYTGDGHVVGPATSTEVCKRYNSAHQCIRYRTNWSVTSATLGNTEGGVQGMATLNSPGPDGYLYNSGSDRIVITLPMEVTSVSFDYEIFPDGTCPSATKCGKNQANLPDFRLLAGADLLSLTQVFQTFGTYPGASNDPATYPHSPHSGHGKNEPAPQYLGTYSGGLGSGITTLAFVDWPQRIGIDNLTINYCAAGECGGNVNVPEPPTLPIVLLALGLLALLPKATRCRAGRR